MRIPAIGVLLLTAAPTVLAQGTTSRDSATTLPGVTVTATRNAAPILTTPLAITKLTGPQLRAFNGFGLDEALSRVPGVIAQSRYGTSDIRLMVRGFGARGAGDRSNSGTSRGIRLLLDGFPETEPDGRTAMDQFDLATAEAIEVIRSSASSLWGNAAGGVISVSTVPESRTPSAEAQGIFGGFGLARYVARTSSPLGENGVVYGNFTNTSFEGWRAHSDARRALFNAGATGMVGDKTKLGLFLVATDNLIHVPGPLTQAQVDADPKQANATYVSRDERRHNRSGRLGVSIDRTLGDESSVSSTFYVNPKFLQRSERGTFRDFTRYHVGGNVLGHATVNTGALKSRLTAGLDAAYQDGAILFYNLSATNGRGPTLSDNKGEGAVNVGMFLQDELAVNDRLSLLLGARYDRIAYHYRSFLPNPPVRKDSRDFTRVSPKLGVNFLLTPGRALYANVGGGIEVPAGNETDPTPGAGPALLNPLLDPIQSTSYEVGYKAISHPVFGSGLSLGYDLALYDIEVTNEIVPYNGGRFYLTAGKAQRRGAELGLTADTKAGFFASAAITASRNKYLEYVVDSAVLLPNDATKAGKRADYSDNKIVGLPDFMSNIEVGTTVPGLKALRVKAGFENSGEYFANDANNVKVPSYSIVNLTAELRNLVAMSNGWGVRGFVTVRNLSDKRYIGSAFLNPDLVGGAPAAYEPGMPRSVIVSLSVGRLR
jgi:iron complex outermembrane recepter protein